MKDDYFKLPRIYTPCPLAEAGQVMLSSAQAHYFRSVMRREIGDNIRIFNGRDGEFLARLSALDKKSGAADVLARLKPQPEGRSEIHLIFAPIKKQRMDILVEKAVELGVTHFHPVLTDHAEVRKINEERLHAQIFEAAEQCERLSIPLLSPIKPLSEALRHWRDGRDADILWCFERADCAPVKQFTGACLGFLIGPEGGFSEREISMLSQAQHIKPVSLGESVLRVETAVIVCLARIV